MIIIISPEDYYENETDWVNRLLGNSLDLFHIRKPDFSEKNMTDYILNINIKFRDQIVLHSHHHLAEELGVKRLHFKQEKRKKGDYKNVKSTFILSTSTHHIDDFNTLECRWSYAFLSPVFPSISKTNYGSESDVFENLSLKKNNSVRLIALGGITSENMKTALDKGADGIALLGSIWQTDNPLKTFKQCRR